MASLVLRVAAPDYETTSLQDNERGFASLRRQLEYREYRKNLLYLSIHSIPKDLKPKQKEKN